MINNKTIIAIDGPAASGKGSLARKLAQALGYGFLDTGALYRRVALDMLNAHQDIENETLAVQTAQSLDMKALDLDDSRLRSDDVGSSASKVARYDGVRAALFDFQRNFATRSDAGAVLDGRDIGTIICPEAQFKLYITADVAKRAQRRHKELQSRGIDATYGDVLAEMQERDARDAVQLDKHFAPGHQMTIIDTSDMSPEQVLDAALNIIHSSNS